MIVAASTCALLPALAQKSDDASILDESLKIYAVNVVKSRFYETFTGYGIYLGRGAAITAAHVVGRWHILTDLQVMIAGQKLPAKIVKEGSLAKTDLTVLSVDETRLPVSLGSGEIQSVKRLCASARRSWSLSRRARHAPVSCPHCRSCLTTGGGSVPSSAMFRWPVPDRACSMRTSAACSASSAGE